MSNEPETLMTVLGVVEPDVEGVLTEQPPWPVIHSATPYDEARHHVDQALAQTKERLRELREGRREINAAISALVESEALLERMARVHRVTRRSAS